MFLLLPWKLDSARWFAPSAITANGLLVAANVVCYLTGCMGAVSQASPFANVLLYGFSHAGFWHLATNIWLLWLFGNPVNRRLGNGLYLLVYLATILVLGLFARWWIDVPMIGSSGAVYAVIAIAVMLEPRAVLQLLAVAIFPLTAVIGLFASPRQTMQWFVRWESVRVPLLAGLALVPLLLLSELFYFGLNWATAAHLLGVVCGLVTVVVLPAGITMRRRPLAAV